MGWEWHDRRRASNGRFDPLAPRGQVTQLHIRMTHDQATAIRRAASKAREELSEYVRRACALRMMQDSGRHDR